MLKQPTAIFLTGFETGLVRMKQIYGSEIQMRQRGFDY